MSFINRPDSMDRHRISGIITTFSAIMLSGVLFAAPAQALTLGQAARIATSAAPAAFNAIEIAAPAQAESRVEQWNRARRALGNDMRTLQDCLLDSGNCTTQAMREWRDMALAARHQDENTRLNMVNSFFNRWSYISDQENYRTSEYWASPLEFMARGGDCEDFAIAKYVTLKLLGYQDRSLRIMAVLDQSRDGMGHAVLSVATAQGIMVLDNRSTVVYDNAHQTAYVPRFAVNESGIYTYAPQPRIAFAY